MKVDTNTAAGLLMFRKLPRNVIEFFLVHPGGPFFKTKDKGVWTIPKGLIEENENLLAAAVREFQEETGIVPKGPYVPLESIQQKGGKVVHAWAFAGEWDPSSKIVSNAFELEWPPGAGKLQTFPEIDKAAWMTFEMANEYIIPEQLPFIRRAMLNKL